MAIRGKGVVIIGNCFHCGTGCTIITSNHDYDHGELLPYGRQHQVLEQVVIEDNVWFGANVTVLGDAHIGEGAIIQANALVIGEVPPLAIVGGYRRRSLNTEIKSIMRHLKVQVNFLYFIYSRRIG
jgi:acetyltransferase-like isoleucine patch superfamily enzyme